MAKEVDPLKQGLKLDYDKLELNREEAKEVDPLKQGLKHKRYWNDWWK